MNIRQGRILNALTVCTVFVALTAMFSCTVPVDKQGDKKMNTEITDWKSELEQTLKVFGHRNWIVIADAAYPEQSNPAIQTLAIDADQLEAVTFVSQLVEKAGHVDANIFIDKELAFIEEEDAPGIAAYRADLDKILEGKPVKTMLHENIIRELDASAKLFNVLIIKTDLAIPYTSVFFQLECGYWNADAENRLRTQIGKE
jgi:L-fucose mutarotase/ribose pyranase (RbsD/FucU family)